MEWGHCVVAVVRSSWPRCAAVCARAARNVVARADAAAAALQSGRQAFAAAAPPIDSPPLPKSRSLTMHARDLSPCSAQAASASAAHV